MSRQLIIPITTINLLGLKIDSTGVKIKGHDLARRNKYGNKKIKIDGITFDSKKEAARYKELKLMQKSGYINGLELQPKFELVPKFEYKGKTERAINYFADFKYKDITGKEVVEDVKGHKTQVYKMKRKMLLQKYKDIDFREV